MGNSFNGNVAVVTDVTRPVGRAVAAILAEEGASLVVNDPGLKAPGTSTAGAVAEAARLSGVEAIATREDVATMSGAEALIATAVDAYGRLDVLVNSVGLRVDRPVHEMTPDDFDRVVAANVKATFAPTRFAAIRFRQQRGGRIVNLTSDAGLGEAGASSFAAASEAVVGMTRTVGRDLGKYGVTCNALCVSDGSESAAALAVLLCTEAMPHVNGYAFGARGGSLYVYANPAIERSIHKWGIFTMDEIAAQAPNLVASGLPMSEKLEGRVAIVTGAGRGIGRSVATLLAEMGAAVVVNDLGGSVDGAGRSVFPAADVVAEIRAAGGKAVASYESVADYDAAGAIVQTAVDEYGRVDILCNAAGILRDRMVFNMTEEEWDTVLRVHLYGSFNMVRHCVPRMIDRAYGRIALFSSVSGLGSAGQANYTSAKEGIVGFTRSLARELAVHGITLNAIYPGANTRMMATVPEHVRHRPSGGGASEIVGSLEPEETLAPENNAAKIVYLCTEAGGAFNGRVVGTNGWAMSLYSHRRISKSIHTTGAWTLDQLERLVPISLAAGLTNPAPQEPPR